jgi:hypothetical protein
MIEPSRNQWLAAPTTRTKQPFRAELDRDLEQSSAAAHFF